MPCPILIVLSLAVGQIGQGAALMLILSHEAAMLSHPSVRQWRTTVLWCSTAVAARRTSHTQSTPLAANGGSVSCEVKQRPAAWGTLQARGSLLLLLLLPRTFCFWSVRTELTSDTGLADLALTDLALTTCRGITVCNLRTQVHVHTSEHLCAVTPDAQHSSFKQLVCSRISASGVPQTSPGLGWSWCCALATCTYHTAPLICQQSSKRCWCPGRSTTSYALATCARRYALLYLEHR